jgi:N-acetylmuramoyl-L-alanine amidase
MAPAWLTARGLAALAILAAAGALLPAAAAPRRADPVRPTVDLEELGRSYGLAVERVRPGRELRLRSRWTRLEFAADSREIAWNGYRLFLGEPVAAQGRRLKISGVDRRTALLPLLDPSSVPPPGALRVIAIDAGHGGHDVGTGNARLGVVEKTFTLDVARRLEACLRPQGYRIVLTRADDRYVGLPDRPAIANRAGADLFVSIHFNSLPNNGRIGGVETYALTPAGVRSTAAAARGADDRIVHPGNRQDHWNTVLCAAIHRQLVDRLRAPDRGMKRARFAVLRTIRCPAVLVEAGFLSNETEARKIRTPAYRQHIAQAIAAGIHDYAGRLQSASAAAEKG